MIDDIVLVSEEEMKKAILTLLDTTHQLAEELEPQQQLRLSLKRNFKGRELPSF